MRDNRERRIVPVEMSVLSVGYGRTGKYSPAAPMSAAEPGCHLSLRRQDLVHFQRSLAISGMS